MKMDTKLYKKNSTIFLLPLLGISKDKLLTDNFITTFIMDYRFSHMTNYISIAYKGDNKYLDSLPELYGKVSNESGQSLYYFLLGLDNELNYARFLTGKYSKFTVQAKEKIIDFWNANKLSLIYGILYKTNYAKLLYLNNLKYHTDGIVNTREFEYWPKPNLSKETLVTTTI